MRGGDMPMITMREPALSVKKDKNNGTKGPKPISMVGGGRAGSLNAFAEGRGGNAP